MSLQAFTYYCEQCEDHSLGDSCLLHPQPPEAEVKNAAREELKAHQETFKDLSKFTSGVPEQTEDWETEVLQAWKENRPDDILKIVRRHLEEKEENAYEDGVTEGKSEGYAKGLNDGFAQAKSEMIKKIGEWYEKLMKGETNLAELNDFLNE